MFPKNYIGIRTALANVQKDMTRSAHYATTADRERNVDKITGLVQKFFVKKDVAALGSAHALIVELENSLRRARYEASRYEFKLGICELGASPCLDAGMYSKLGRTACAIANTNPQHDGYIYLGVANKESAASRVTQLFGISPIMIGDVYFIGLDHELKILSLNIKSYVKMFIREISKLPISQPLKTQLSTSIDHAEYMGRAFIRLTQANRNFRTMMGLIRSGKILTPPI